MKRMPRLFQIGLCALAVLCMTSSCQKEGRLSKKAKLSTVMMQKTVFCDGQELYHVGEQRTQQWFWDGNNLFRIDYTEDESSYSEIIFSEHRRIEQTRVDAYGLVSLFYYDGRYLDSIRVSAHGNPAYSCIFSHEDGKVSSMIIHPYGSTADTTALTKGPLQLLPMVGVSLPQCVIDEQVAHMASKGKSQGDVEYAYQWNKNNVSSMVVTYADGTKEQYSYTYDENRNPYYQCLTYYEGNAEGGLTNILSKNNVLTIVNRSGNRQSEYQYTYTYDGSLPMASLLEYSYQAMNNQTLETSVYTVKEHRTYTYKD